LGYGRGERSICGLSEIIQRDFEVGEMRKKTRNTLTDLLQEVDIKNLQEPEIQAKQVKSTPPKKQTQPKKNTTQTGA
jgi:hypothetical protein